ncbi:putative leucine-rich repeat-containing protein DDB_G0290503 isoform X2 [Adelges cooleyi]|uniref:putative leucine-rich repeat-containing protein DDB_G0290503 isoform X2 n=1 Tax=Adelges cooleyi TaxID=133065 RepID=UPI00218089B7|nr:putative leucine-rich repeat-containing protein DDB_G0290503 isoform X2 [Adelges cooleyi]
MAMDTLHEVYQKELNRMCEKHRIELEENEQRHRDEIKRLCAENALEITKLKQILRSEYQDELKKIKNKHEQEIEELRYQFESRLNDLKDCDLDTLTKRIEEDITKTQVKHKKIVSYLINEIYKLKKTIISSSFDDNERPSSLDSYDPKILREGVNDVDIETSDYVLSQDSIDTQIKDLEDIIQERDDLRTVAMTLRQLTKHLCSFLIDQQEELNNSIVEHMNEMECGGISNGGAGDGCHINSTDEFHGLVQESRSPRRVHFVPNIEEIVSLIDENSILADFTNVDASGDTSNLLRSNLNACLEKLKEEAATLSDLTTTEPKVLRPTSEIICHKSFFDKKLDYYKKELEKQKSDYKKLFMENSALEQENDFLKKQLDNEVSSASYNKQCIIGIQNNNLMLLQHKAQELIKNYEDWTPLQSLLDEYHNEYCKMVDDMKNEKEDLTQQLMAADNRLHSLNLFLKDQTAEREHEREQYDSEMKLLKEQLRDKERLSLGAEDLKTHTEMLVNEHKEAEERYEKLKAKQQKTEEMLKVSEQEVTSLKEMICGMEQRMEIFAQNEISNKNYISSLTKMLKEEQTNQQDMLAELDRMRNLLEEQNQSSTPEFGDAEIVVNNFRLKLKDLEKSISKRIKELDQFWVVDECSSPMSEDISVAERSELPNNISLEKNSSPSRIVATLDDVFVRVQERLSRMYKSEDAILKHESEQRLSLKALNKQLKDLQSEVDTLRTRLAEKSDQLTAAKMKIDNLRVLKNNDVETATSQLHDTLEKIIMEHKKCSQVLEDKNNEISKLNDLTRHLKNMLSSYEFKLIEKQDIDPKAISDLELKVVKLAEENMTLQDGNNEIDSNGFSKSIMTNSRASENEHMRRAVPNDSNTLASLQFRDHHHNVSIREPSMSNLSLPSPQLKDRTNMYTTMNDDLKLTLANTKLELENRNALIKIMEKDSEAMETQVKTLEENVQLLRVENSSLEERLSKLIENENLLTDKLNDALSEIEKKQITLKELETLGVKLRAEIQPLEFMKDNLEKKLASFKDCNKKQTEKIKFLENVNEELVYECNRLKDDQMKLLKSLQHDNSTLKRELLQTEKFKMEVGEQIEELKNEYERLKSENVALREDIDNLMVDKSRLKHELAKMEELHAAELKGCRDLLADEQEQKHKTNMNLLRTIEELTNQATEHKYLLSSLEQNKDCELTTSFSDFGSDKNTTDMVKKTMALMENDLIYEQKKCADILQSLQDKEAETEQLNAIKNHQEEKIADFIRRVQAEVNCNTELKINVIKMENRIRELETKSKIDSGTLTESKQEDSNLVKKLYEELNKVLETNVHLDCELNKVLDTNENLDRELNRILDIKEEMDEQLAEAHKTINELESYKQERATLLEQIAKQNMSIGNFKQQLNDADDVLRVQRERAEKDKRLFELKILELQKELKDTKQKHSELVKEFERLKSKSIQKQPSNECTYELYNDLKMKLTESEKKILEWEKKYNDAIFENRNVQHKFECMDAEFQHLQNKMEVLQNKLELSKFYEDRLKSDIKDFTLPEDLKQRQTDLIVNLEVENAKLTSKVMEYRDKYSKCKAHIEDIKTMLTSQNIRKLVENNIELCKTRDELRTRVADLNNLVKDLTHKLSQKTDNWWPVLNDRCAVTRIESQYRSLVWQKMYLVKLASGKDKLVRIMLPELEDGLLKTTMQKICGKRKMSRFKIVAICMIAMRRMQMTAAAKYAGLQLENTHYSLPRKMPWIKC